jgi:ADP-ribosylglycohydrolase
MAVGDALGAPLEGLTYHQIRSAYGMVAEYVDGVRAWPKKPFRWRAPGLYTDDTQQALVLADSLLRFGQIDPAWVGATYLQLANPRGSHLGAHRAVGRSFRGVIDALEAGRHPLDCGQTSAGIGAAMRIAPLGIYYADADTDTLIDAVLSASRITHRDLRSLAGAAAVALTIRRLIRGEPREPSLLFKLAHDIAAAEDQIARAADDLSLTGRDHRRSISIAVARVESLLEVHRDVAHQAIVEEARRHGPEPDCRRPTMGFPPALIPCCLYVLFTHESFEDALVEIVNLGGDTDTAGAILGALAGCLYGEAAIPVRWLDLLHNRLAIAQRAELLAAGSPSPTPPEELIETERQLTQLESSLREAQVARRQSEDDLGANRRR